MVREQITLGVQLVFLEAGVVEEGTTTYSNAKWKGRLNQLVTEWSMTIAKGKSDA